jgi:hypothetical protein
MPRKKRQAPTASCAAATERLPLVDRLGASRDCDTPRVATRVDGNFGPLNGAKSSAKSILGFVIKKALVLVILGLAAWKRGTSLPAFDKLGMEAGDFFFPSSMA